MLLINPNVEVYPLALTYSKFIKFTGLFHNGKYLPTMIHNEIKPEEYCHRELYL